MASYCQSCFRDLASDTATCQSCVTSTASRSSLVIGLLLFAAAMAGMLTFDTRLTMVAAAIAVVLIGVQIARVLRS